MRYFIIIIAISTLLVLFLFLNDDKAINTSNETASQSPTPQVIDEVVIESTDGTVGRWCDVWFPGGSLYTIMTISKKYGDYYELHNLNSDKSTGTYELNYHKGFYYNLELPKNNKYNIEHGTGRLVLANEDGFLRYAKRLKNTPQPNECP